jgi:hypothetical protein
VVIAATTFTATAMRSPRWRPTDNPCGPLPVWSVLIQSCDRGVVGKPSEDAASITAWCSAAVGTVLILGSAFLSDQLVVPAAVAGLVLVAVGVTVFTVRLLRG